MGTKKRKINDPMGGPTSKKSCNQDALVNKPVGILKKDPTKSLGSPNRKVCFTPPQELSETLKTADENTNILDEGGLEKLMSEFESLRGNSLVLWLQEIQANICVLGRKSKGGHSGLESMVQQLVKLNWRDMELEAVEAHKGFLVNLVSANTCFTSLTVHWLLENFKPTVEKPEMDALIFRHTHHLLRKLLTVSPVGVREELLSKVAQRFPFIKMPAYKQVCYVTALLEMSSYLERSTSVILAVIMEKIIKLDAHLSREAIDEHLSTKEEGLEVDAEQENMITSLDLMIRALIAFIDSHTLTDGVFNQVKSQPIISYLLEAFDAHMLPAYKIVHTPFVFFHLASQDACVLQQFLAHLWKTFTDPNTASILRQTCVAYISSLLSRLSAVPPALLLFYLEKLTNWAHLYLRAHETSGHSNFMHTDVSAHGAFYSCCQAVFYLFAFRHSELMSVPARAKKVASLSWHTLVTSSLNPLRICLPAVGENFSLVASHYQLAYCEAVLARNRRINLPVVGSASGGGTDASKPVTLDYFFPFDPYLLENTRDLFEDKYLHYTSWRPTEQPRDEGLELDEEEEEEENRGRRNRLDSSRSSISCRSRKDSVGCLTELLVQDLAA